MHCARARLEASSVNSLLESASKPGQPLAATAEHGDILGFETKPLVSTDYNNDPRSTIVDAASTMVRRRQQMKLRPRPRTNDADEGGAQTGLPIMPCPPPLDTHQPRCWPCTALRSYKITW
eukprot:scaffold34114_cov41-Tisochrysis_lutea.AAC.3